MATTSGSFSQPSPTLSLFFEFHEGLLLRYEQTEFHLRLVVGSFPFTIKKHKLFMFIYFIIFTDWIIVIYFFSSMGWIGVLERPCYPISTRYLSFQLTILAFMNWNYIDYHLSFQQVFVLVLQVRIFPSFPVIWNLTLFSCRVSLSNPQYLTAIISFYVEIPNRDLWFRVTLLSIGSNFLLLVPLHLAIPVCSEP